MDISVQSPPPPAGFRWVFCSQFKHWRSGKILKASDYGQVEDAGVADQGGEAVGLGADPVDHVAAVGWSDHQRRSTELSTSRAKYRIGQRLRPCPGCVECLICIACENETCGSPTHRTSICDGTGTLPARVRK